MRPLLAFVVLAVAIGATPPRCCACDPASRFAFQQQAYGGYYPPVRVLEEPAVFDFQGRILPPRQFSGGGFYGGSGYFPQQQFGGYGGYQPQFQPQFQPQQFGGYGGYQPQFQPQFQPQQFGGYGGGGYFQPQQFSGACPTGNCGRR